jgi:hypothetical protein
MPWNEASTTSGLNGILLIADFTEAASASI